MRIRGLLVVAALCAGCLGGSGGKGAPTTRPSHLGVTAAFPSSWSVVWRPCHDCADPRSVFVAASYRLSGGLRRMMCHRIPDDGVGVSLTEVRPGLLGDKPPSRKDFPPRPASFRLRPLGRFGVMESCAQPRAHLVRFRDSGRVLYVWAMFGPRPSRAVRARAEAVLNSLRIAPLR